MILALEFSDDGVTFYFSCSECHGVSEIGFPIVPIWGYLCRTWTLWLSGDEVYTDLDSPLHVLHRCDNKKCVNTSHLYIGTNGDNVRDSYNRGRKVGAAKLTEDDVIKVRRMTMDGSSGAHVAKMFNINQATVFSIKNNKTWKSLPGIDMVKYRTKLEELRTELNETKVKEIKLKLMKGCKMNNVAEEYGVPFFVIYDIKHGKTWKHVTIDPDHVDSV